MTESVILYIPTYNLKLNYIILKVLCIKRMVRYNLYF